MSADAPPQLLHAMLPVADLERSLVFYRRHFGLVEIRRIAFPEIPRTLVFLGHPAAGPAAMQLELWHEPAAGGPTPSPAESPHGGPLQAASSNALRGHVGIAISGLDAFYAGLVSAGVTTLRAPAALRPGGRRIAMIADPDGHELELLEAG